MECPNHELLHVDLDSSEMILSPIRLVRESKTVVDSGFHALDSGHWTPAFQVQDSGFFVSGTWIPDSNRRVQKKSVLQPAIRASCS